MDSKPNSECRCDKTESRNTTALLGKCIKPKKYIGSGCQRGSSCHVVMKNNKTHTRTNKSKILKFVQTIKPNKQKGFD
jgi:hypothetical protein